MDYLTAKLEYITILIKADERRIAEGFPGQRLVIVPPSIVRNTRNLPVMRNIFPTHLGMFQNAKGHYVHRPEGASEHILIGCIAGSGVCHIRSQQWTLKPGNLIFLPKDIEHKYISDAENPWSIFWIHFIGDDAPHHLKYLDISEKQPLTNVSNIGGLIDAFEDIFQHTESGYTDTAQLCLSTSFSRFLGICRLYQRAVKANQQRIEDRILESVRVMRESLHRTLSLSDLASIAGWSPTYYCAMFKKQLSISPMEFFTRLKIHHACNQLKMTNEPVSNIAASLGYEDSFYFSKLFRGRQGVSPREYRKRHSLLV